MNEDDDIYSSEEQKRAVEYLESKGYKIVDISRDMDGEPMAIQMSKKKKGDSSTLMATVEDDGSVNGTPFEELEQFESYKSGKKK